MTIAVSQSGFTDELGTSVSSLVDGNADTGWIFDLYADATGKTITVDMGGWFDASTLAQSHVVISSPNLIPAGQFAMQLSADATNWYNMPDATSSVNLGSSNDLSTNFTPWADGTNFRYIRLIGVGGSYDLPAWIKAHGYLSSLNKYTTLEYLTSTGDPITVDSSGGANPSPPTGTPSTDGGSSNPPAPPVDSGVTVDVSSVSLRAARSDSGTVRVTSTTAAVARSDIGSVRVAGVSFLVASLVKRARVFGSVVG